MASFDFDSKGSLRHAWQNKVFESVFPRAGQTKGPTGQVNNQYRLRSQ